MKIRRTIRFVDRYDDEFEVEVNEDNELALRSVDEIGVVSTILALGYEDACSLVKLVEELLREHQ